jgi:hypothetical protein
MALSATLKDIKEKLQDANPTILYTGNSFHIYQPIDALILEKENIFSNFDQPSKRFLRVCRTISF